MNLFSHNPNRFISPRAALGPTTAVQTLAAQFAKASATVADISHLMSILSQSVAQQMPKLKL